MSDAVSQRLRAALDECALHARVLARDLSLLPGVFSAQDVQALSDDIRMVLDQAAYRFMKLQDALGERVLPGLLETTLDPLPPEAPFAQKLQRLVRLGIVPSAEQWRTLREVRNALAHEYPENPALRAASLNRFRTGLSDLLRAWEHVNAFAGRLAHGSPGC